MGDFFNQFKEGLIASYENEYGLAWFVNFKRLCEHIYIYMCVCFSNEYESVKNKIKFL